MMIAIYLTTSTTSKGFNNMCDMKQMIFFLISVAVFWKHILSLQVIPERAMKRYLNEKYIYDNATIFVRRYSRKSPYYINMEGTNKLEFGNNVSLTLVFFEFLHNEYKRSFVEMKFPKICDSINNDPYVGKAFRLIGFPCPLPVGTHRVMNISVPMQEFPNVWPFERCKVEATLLQNKNGDTIAIADIYIMFKQKHHTK